MPFSLFRWRSVASLTINNMRLSAIGLILSVHRIVFGQTKSWAASNGKGLSRRAQGFGWVGFVLAEKDRRRAVGHVIAEMKMRAKDLEVGVALFVVPVGVIFGTGQSSTIDRNNRRTV